MKRKKLDFRKLSEIKKKKKIASIKFTTKNIFRGIFI